MSHIKEEALASRGEGRIEWASSMMPVVRGIGKKFSR